MAWRVVQKSIYIIDSRRTPAVDAPHFRLAKRDLGFAVGRVNRRSATTSRSHLVINRLARFEIPKKLLLHHLLITAAAAAVAAHECNPARQGHGTQALDREAWVRVSSADLFKAGVARQRAGPTSLGIARVRF